MPNEISEISHYVSLLIYLVNLNSELRNGRQLQFIKYLLDVIYI